MHSHQPFHSVLGRLRTYSLFYKNVLKTPLLSIAVKEKIINLHFYFHTSLCCLKRFYEGLKGLVHCMWDKVLVASKGFKKAFKVCCIVCGIKY